MNGAARRSGLIRGSPSPPSPVATAHSPCVAGEPGTATAVVFSALRRRRRIVLLELIEPPPSPSALRRGLREAWRRRVLRPAAARSVLAAQVLTEAEREECSRSFGIAPERIRHVPWAWCRDPDEPAPIGERAGVVVSGRASCDWETVFAAARRRDWDLDRDLRGARPAAGRRAQPGRRRPRPR